MIITLISFYLLLCNRLNTLFKVLLERFACFKSRYAQKTSIIALTLSLVCSSCIFLPIMGLPLYGYIISLTNYLSISSFVLIALTSAQQILPVFHVNKTLISLKEKRFIYRIIAYTGLAFYPMTLGLTQFDPYTLGYWHSFPQYYNVILALSALISIVCCYLKYYYLPVIFILSFINYSLLLYPSYNWWDHFIDPWIWLYACYLLATDKPGP